MSTQGSVRGCHGREAVDLLHQGPDVLATGKAMRCTLTGSVVLVN